MNMSQNDDPWCDQCGHAQSDHPRDGRCGAATEEGCDCPRFMVAPVDDRDLLPASDFFEKLDPL